LSEGGEEDGSEDERTKVSRTSGGNGREEAQKVFSGSVLQFLARKASGTGGKERAEVGNLKLE
jgi:hypothetical protein